MELANRLIGAGGALALAIGTAAAAASAHLDDPSDAARLGGASLMLLIHGIGLIALAMGRRVWPSLQRRLAAIALVVGLGLLLFAGSLLLAVFFDVSTAFAPFGGGLIILAWLAMAVLIIVPTSAGSDHS